MGKKGYFILAGPPGGGKSFEALRTFQGSFMFRSAVNNTHYYETWLNTAEGMASGAAMPTRIVTIDRSIITDSKDPKFRQVAPKINGVRTSIPQQQWFEWYLNELVDLCTDEFSRDVPLTYRNVIIDEGGTFWARIFNEIQPRCFSKKGTPDPLKAYNEIEKWSMYIVDLIRQLPQFGVNVALVAHDKDPDPENEKQGGAKFPSQAVMKQMGADADGILLRMLEAEHVELNLGTTPEEAAAMMQAVTAAKKAPDKRIWIAYASHNWQSKLRGLPDTAFSLIRHMALRDILPMAGFEP